MRPLIFPAAPSQPAPADRRARCVNPGIDRSFQRPQTGVSDGALGAIIARFQDDSRPGVIDLRQSSGPKFGDMKRPFVEKLELRITMRRVAEFFAALNALSEPDKGILFQEVVKCLREYMTDAAINPAVPTARPESFVEQCRALATIAPNDRIEHVLLKIADVHELELALKAEGQTIITDSDAA